jgi:hypothetical protein
MIGNCVIWSITVNKQVAVIISTYGFLPIPIKLRKICIGVHYRCLRELISVNAKWDISGCACEVLVVGCVGAKVRLGFKLRSSVVSGWLCRSQPGHTARPWPVGFADNRGDGFGIHFTADRQGTPKPKWLPWT